MDLLKNFHIEQSSQVQPIRSDRLIIHNKTTITTFRRHLEILQRNVKSETSEHHLFLDLEHLSCVFSLLEPTSNLTASVFLNIIGLLADHKSLVTSCGQLVALLVSPLRFLPTFFGSLNNNPPSLLFHLHHLQSSIILSSHQAGSDHHHQDEPLAELQSLMLLMQRRGPFSRPLSKHLPQEKLRPTSCNQKEKKRRKKGKYWVPRL